jgi:predicted Zn finger-like uncharacterized protein
MSLATRCTNCGTIFRVVQDQLKVSEGWVRCGRCGEVFNALQALFDLEREAPPAFAGTAGERAADGPGAPASDPLRAARTADPPARAPAEASGGTRTVPERASAGSAAARAEAWAPADDGAMPVPDEPLLRTPTPGPAGPPVESILDTRAEPGFDPTRQEEALTRVDDPIDADQLPAGSPEPLPAFLRDAADDRAPASPLARAAVAFGIVALAAALGAQVAVHHRDRVAQSWPWARPLLVQWCQVAGCELLEAPRRIEAFTVETSSLTRAAAASDAYRLSVTLRNRSPNTALMPSIDIALNDSSGKLLARRALHPADFRVSRPVVAAGSETTLQLVMTAARGQVNGYTIEIFYP